MADFDTIDAITDNIETVLKGLGAFFSTETHEDIPDIPAGSLPLGQVFYEGESFEYNHGEKPGYAEADFLARVILTDRNPRLLTREEQSWVHLIRDGLTVAALNIGSLASSKLVSRVNVMDAKVDHPAPSYGVVNYRARIRYREL